MTYDDHEPAVPECFTCDRCGLRSDEATWNHAPDICHRCADAIDDGQPWPPRDDHREIEDAIRAIVCIRQAINDGDSAYYADRCSAIERLGHEASAALVRRQSSIHRGDSRRVIRLEDEIRRLAMEAQRSAIDNTPGWKPRGCD